MEKYIAHIDETGNIQTVKEHCEQVAALASQFADSFGAEEDAYFAGLLHDIGKFSKDFQTHILNSDSKHVDHSTAGAKEAQKHKNLEAALAIAGHHGGIPDLGNQTDTGEEITLIGRLKRTLPDYHKYADYISVPQVRRKREFSSLFDRMFYTRMLFSCLVDADYLDTEKFMGGSGRQTGYDSIHELNKIIDKYTDDLIKKASGNLNVIRSHILNACKETGKNSQKAIFRLSLPTGAGKTIDTITFALKHAEKNNLNRVIYVIPYTSIIDQTAEIYKKIFGEANVLEHHSEVMFSDSEDGCRARLACENWDMPIVITTAVQFFESIYSSKTSKCRKLHNIADSIIVFDEAQMIPPAMLNPCLMAINELYRNYGCSIVLSTATQPPFEIIFNQFSVNIPIIDIYHLTEKEKRAFEHCAVQDLKNLSVEELKEIIAERQSSLIIFNTKKDARDFFLKIDNSNKYYLTTDLMPFDRKKTINRIKEDLKNGKCCTVVATSLIEAGVDLDFPYVYREFCGLDSIIQAAGRCNREGKQSVQDCGTYYFRLTDHRNNRMMEKNIAAAEKALREHEFTEAMNEYFSYLWFLKETDKKKILMLHENGENGVAMPFREIDERFKLIENDTVPVYIPCAENEEILQDFMRTGFISRNDLRKLNHFSVNVYLTKIDEMLRFGVVRLQNGLYILEDDSYYNDITGLNTEPVSKAIIL